jgi:hypothetical protein
MAIQGMPADFAGWSGVIGPLDDAAACLIRLFIGRPVDQ